MTEKQRSKEKDGGKNSGDRNIMYPGRPFTPNLPRPRSSIKNGFLKTDHPRVGNLIIKVWLWAVAVAAAAAAPPKPKS
ncbi:hypothetical protein SDJN03_30254, partial [Cucurbita argyrosperma subsp. sororia]